MWITYHSLLKIHSLTKIIRVIQQRCFARNLTVLFAELKDKESSLTIIKVNLRFRQLRLNYINNWKKAKEEHLRLVTTAIRVGVIAKADDEVYVLSIMKIYSYFSSVFSTEPKKFELLKISAVMKLFWKSLPPCKNGREEDNSFFRSVLIASCCFQEKNIKFSEVALASVHCNCLISSCLMIAWRSRPWNATNTTAVVYFLIEKSNWNTYYQVYENNWLWSC